VELQWNWIRWILKRIKLIPIIGIPFLAVILGVLIFPLYGEQNDRPEIEGIPTLEKGMAEAMKSDCGSTNTILCEKLDKIIENQEVIIDYLSNINNTES